MSECARLLELMHPHVAPVIIAVPGKACWDALADHTDMSICTLPQRVDSVLSDTQKHAQIDNHKYQKSKICTHSNITMLSRYFVELYTQKVTLATVFTVLALPSCKQFEVFGSSLSTSTDVKHVQNVPHHGFSKVNSH